MPKPKASPTRAAGLFMLAAAVGALGGVLGVLFQSLLQGMMVLGLADGSSVVEAAKQLSSWQRVLVPTAGGLLAATGLWWLGRRKPPFGIGDVMDLVIRRSKGISTRESIVQIWSSACSIATGSSIGKESANSQLGATVASGLGRLFRCTSREKAVLLGCGVAAGMAISYNAPIAGALFVMEVVLGNFAMEVFAPIVVSAVIATLVHQALRPDIATHALYEAEQVSNLTMMDPVLVLSAMLLGCICGVGAIGFRKILTAGRTGFRRLGWSPLLALPAGGLLVGVMGIWRPEVWGNGQDVVTSIISPGGNHAVGMLIVILLLKSVATSVSIGSGALGGVFTPTLVVGAACGAVYAHGFDGLFPAGYFGLSASELQTGFALVGMAGLVAGTTHAPITAVLLAFEFTRNYELILPVMLCSILASLVARMIDRDSIFDAKLREKGHDLVGGIEALALQTNYVRDVMRQDTHALINTATFREVMDVFAGARRDTIYVVDETDALVGRIHIHDIKTFINDPTLASVVIAGDLTRAATPVTPAQNLAQSFDLFDDPDLDELPVIAADDDQRLAGRLTRRDVIALISDEVLGRRNLRAKLRTEGADEDTYVQLPRGCDVARVRLLPGMAGTSLADLDFPRHHGLTVMLVIEQDDHGLELRHMPDPDLRPPPRSTLIVIGLRARIDEYERQMQR